MKTNMIKRILSTVLTMAMALTLVPWIAVGAATQTYSKTTTDIILDNIESQYSEELSDAIEEMLFDSDYSVFLDDGETLRGYYSNGNKKSWPISDADKNADSVEDRGNTVYWGKKSSGSVSYAYFFSQSVYETSGKKTSDKVNIDKKDHASSAAVLKDFVTKTLNPGEHFATNVSKFHSVVFLSTGEENGEEGFYIAEYLGGATKDQGGYVEDHDKDQFLIKFYTYENFVIEYANTVWYAYDAYETSKFAGDDPGVPPVKPAVTRDIVLVLDISGSMYGEPLNNTKVAAKQFVDQILDNAHDTRIALVTFGTDVYTNVGFASDKDVLKSAIDYLGTSGVTNMYGGLARADELLVASDADKKAVVVMADGAPNEGVYSTSKTVIVDGKEIYFNDYKAAIHDLSQSFINDKDYTIYSLAFGMSYGSNNWYFMKSIASMNAKNEPNFWQVTTDNLGEIVFTYEDIADTIVTKKSIIIAIECPVEVELKYNGETLSKDNTQTSFGKVTVTPAPDGNNYEFVLDYNCDYEIIIKGTDNGTMDFAITYTEGDTEEKKVFKNVPITPDSVISTSATDDRADFALYLDNDGDGSVDEGWETTNENSTANEASDDINGELNITVTEPEPDTETFEVSASVKGGKYKKNQTVELSANKENVEIYYTTNKKDPIEDGELYTDAIKITKATTLKFVGVDEDGNQTDVVTEKYTINKETGGSSVVSEYTIKFDTDGGTAIKNQVLYENQKVKKPEDPEKEGYVFKGWYRVGKEDAEYDFDSIVKRGFTLCAKWESVELHRIVLTIGEKAAVVFGKDVENDVAPMIVNGRTMLPIRFVAEALGARVRWSERDRKVTIIGEDIEIEIFVDSDIAYVNGESVKLDSAAFIENGRTFLPLRFVSENLGADVEWNGEERSVTITK